MRSLWPRKTASRKFIDLINRESTKWANWDPWIAIKAGDYGSVDKETGRFVKEGNIYSEPSLASLAAKYKPETGEAIGEYIVKSSNTIQQDVRVNAHAGIAALAGVTFKGQWKFDDSRGALLVMVNPRATSVPDGFLPAAQDCDLFKSGHKKLVTQVFTCPAYFLYYSGKTNELVNVSLAADVPVAPAAGVSAEIKAGWNHEGTSGLFHDGYNKEAKFAPLYLVQEIRRPAGRRRATPDPTGSDDDSFWAPVEVPWSFLDDDGEEEYD